MNCNCFEMMFKSIILSTLYSMHFTIFVGIILKEFYDLVTVDYFVRLILNIYLHYTQALKYVFRREFICCITS